MQNGNVIVRVWNKRPGSAWSKLVTAIRSGNSKEMNLYINFHLTKRRNAILYKLRNLKKEKIITKFFSDENGSLSFLKNIGGKKLKVTYFSNEKFGIPITLHEDEIDKIVN